MTTKFTFRGQQVTLCTDFDNGALARVEEHPPNVLEIWPYFENEYLPDSAAGGRLWTMLPSLSGDTKSRQQACYAFHFRLEGCGGKALKLRFHTCRERAKPGHPSIVNQNPDFPVFSYDQRHWERMPDKRFLSESDAAGKKIVEVEHTFDQDRAWIAFQYPYTNDRVADLVRFLEPSPWATAEVAGHSTEARRVWQVSITDPGVPLARKRVVWTMGLQHCAELAAGWGLDAMARFLVSNDADAAAARKRLEFKIIPVVNVDAVAEGRGRIHSSGQNLNREWEKPLPVAEVATIRSTLDHWILQGKPLDVFLDFHGFSTPVGLWPSLSMPELAYGGRQSEYNTLLASIRRHFPQIEYYPEQQAGLAAGCAWRRYGAFALSVDGLVYDRAQSQVDDEFADHYERGRNILDLDEVCRAGTCWVRALLDFAQSNDIRPRDV